MQSSTLIPELESTRTVAITEKLILPRCLAGTNRFINSIMKHRRNDAFNFGSLPDGSCRQNVTTALLVVDALNTSIHHCCPLPFFLLWIISGQGRIAQDAGDRQVNTRREDALQGSSEEFMTLPQHSEVSSILGALNRSNT